MNIRQKALLFNKLIETVKTFDEEHNLRLSTSAVEELSVEFGVFMRSFVKRLRKRK